MRAIIKTEEQGPDVWNVSYKSVIIIGTNGRCENTAMGTGRNSQHIQMINSGRHKSAEIKDNLPPQLAAKNLDLGFVIGTKQVEGVLQDFCELQFLALSNHN